MEGWMAVRICVSVNVSMFVFQTWSPCKGIISPSLPDVNKKHILVQKIGNTLIGF
jgi:hypothetical protein